MRRLHLVAASTTLAFTLGLGACSGQPPGNGNGTSTGGDGGEEGTGGATATGGKSGNTGGATGSGGSAGGAGGSGGSSGPDAGGAGGTPAQPGDPTKFRHSKIVKMNTTAAGAGVMGDVANYPVAVVLNAMNFDFSQARDKGEDLRFTTMDGTALPHAIEDWDKAGQWAAVWVKLDKVLGNNDTQAFKMAWGNPAAADASNSKAVFDTKDGFLGVYHLNEDGSETADAYKDSSSYEAHGTGVKMAPGSRADARIGKGTLLQNSKADWKGQWIKVDGPKVVDMFNATADRSITVSAWAKANSFPGHSTIGGYETVFSKGDTSWTLQKFSFNSSWESCTKAPGSGHYCAISRTFRTMTNTWFHFTVVITRGNLAQYINGVADGRTSNAGRVSQHPFGIGQQTQSLMGKREWDGVIDEARVMSVARDANWIKLEFESQKEGQKFLSFGETQSIP